MNNMNQLKENRKQQAKEKTVVKLKSQAETIEDMQWKRDTGNPIIDNFIESKTEVAGQIVIEGHKLDVRMPQRKYTKKFEALISTYDRTNDELQLHEDTAYELTKVQTGMIQDMIPAFDDESDEYRVDQILYNNISSFCWEFYRFFGQKSSVAASEQFGTGVA